MPEPNDETEYGPREAVAEWLAANDIDPRDVPIEGPITIEPNPEGHRRRIRYAALLHDEHGRRYQDPATGDAAREERTAPLKVEPPANVQVSEVSGAVEPPAF
jgi:hypothetical protein